MSVAVAEIRLETALGTPRAASWDDDWLALVDETETRLERRICGAHAPDGEPCELGSTHANGRCRFHGGHPRIGAQPGNTNAMVHGLYSRRLRQCDDMCPMWSVCPFSGMDVLRLSARKRPVCAFEAEAYATATGTSLVQLHSNSNNDEPTNLGTRVSAGRTVVDGGPGIRAGANAVRTETDVSESEAAQAERDALKYVLHFHSLLPGKRDPGPRTLPPGESDYRGEHPPDASLCPADEHRTTRLAQADAIDVSRAVDDDFAPGSEDADEPGAARGDAERAIATDTGGILYAMLQRATLTLAGYSLTEHTEARSANYSLRTSKVSAGLDAFLRIARELRAWTRPGRSHSPTRVARPIASGTANESPDRPMFDERGERIHYDAEGRRLGLPDEMLPFLKQLDAAVEELRREGVDLTPKSTTFGDPI